MTKIHFKMSLSAHVQNLVHQIFRRYNLHTPFDTGNKVLNI